MITPDTEVILIAFGLVRKSQKIGLDHDFFAFGRAPSEEDRKEEVFQLAYDTWEVVDRYRF